MKAQELDPSDLKPARMPASTAPRLVALIATEEEFDWRADFDRSAIQTTAIEGLQNGQRVFEEFGLRPTYALDHPVAEQRGELFRELVTSGKACVGAHLHPWLAPPLTEEVSNRHSYPCYLPPDLERAKLRSLTETIEQHVGIRPRVYQAGRFGVGRQSLASLVELGYRVDASLAPPFDYDFLGGPDFSRFPASPGWAGPDASLLMVPVTGAFVGRLGPRGRGAYRFATRPSLERVRLAGVLSRTRLVERIRLSPEGFEAADMIRLVRFLHERGERVFTFYFHSTSLVPGHTEFVRSAQQLEVFLDRMRRFLDFFLGPFGGVARTHEELHAELLPQRDGETPPAGR